jgi:uncharacterized protein (UPF0332 family)
MTPEVERFLKKARHCLDNARLNLQVHATDDAGRNAYLGAFHAAQALIFERSGKVAKTHHGVHSQFEKLAKDEAGLDLELRRFLPSVYRLKSIADYETGPDSEISPERAAAAMETARRFVDVIARLLERQE